jgi:hypothetical protein
LARPRKSIDIVEVLRLRLGGHSWPQIARSMGLGQETVYRAYRKAIDALQPFQNPKAAKIATLEDSPSRHCRAETDKTSNGRGELKIGVRTSWKTPD